MKYALLVTMLLFSTLAGATTYYIDPNGTNLNNGTSNSPWGTLAYACSRVTTPGDIIHVNAGSYYETSQSKLAIGVSIEGDGTSSVIYSTVGGILFTIQISTDTEGTKGNQHISNLKLDGSDLTAFGAIEVFGRSNVEIYNCTIADFHYFGASFRSGPAEPPNIYATGNKFHDNIVTNSAGQTGTADGNRDGLEIDGQDGMLIYNNTIIADRDGGMNGNCIGGAPGFLKNVKIFNNILHKTYISGTTPWDFCMEFWNFQGGVEIYNNEILGSIDIGGVRNAKGSSDYSVWIHHNSIGQPSFAITGDPVGVFVEGNTNDVIIEKNTFKYLGKGIYFTQAEAGTGLSNIRINSNIFYGMGNSDAGQLSQGWGIFFTSAPPFNHVYTNIWIWNNVFIGMPGTKGNMWGIGLPNGGTATNVAVINNIVANFNYAPVFDSQNGEGTATIDNLLVLNNIFYNNGNGNLPKYNSITPTNYSISNNLTVNPLFVSSTDFHLQTNSPAIGKGLQLTGLTTDYDGNTLNNPPSIGAFEYFSSPQPVYQSSVIENATPALLEMTYNLSLANSAPESSAFSVLVNSIARTVNSVAIAGTKVQLTLSSPVVYGDIITVSYSVPSNNPIQTTSGGVAISIVSKAVTNNCISTIPVYSSSVIENATPTLLDMSYNLTLANVVPASSSFTVLVNNVARSISTVSVSGNKVRLTLTSPVVYGDVVTVTYTAPADKPLQSSAGGLAQNLVSRPVTNNCSSAIPVYSYSVIENSSPARLDMAYSLSLANIVPANSAFSVTVNGAARPVTAVVISATKVRLTLSSQIVYGDVITISYTKPATNPLQTPQAGQAATIVSKPVINNLIAPIPFFTASTVENLTPNFIDITYNLTLATAPPATSAYSVTVNSVSRTISSVTISSSKVRLTLSSSILYGDVITVSYTKPSTNPVQSAQGGLAANLSSVPVTNNCLSTGKVNSPPVVNITAPATIYSGFVGEIDATATYDPNNDPLIVDWTVPAILPVSTVKALRTKFLAPVVEVAQSVDIPLKVSDGTNLTNGKVTIRVLPYKPEYSKAKVSGVETSSYQPPDSPNYIFDGNSTTKWSSLGDKQWLLVKLSEPFRISHIVLAFLQGQQYSSYFDILASKDNITWDPILTKATSCNFTGALQVFDFPLNSTYNEYSYVKYVGHGNSINTLNVVSEFKIFGSSELNTGSGNTGKAKVIVYPNPTVDLLNISIEEPTLKPDKLKIIDVSGKTVFEQVLNPNNRNPQIPITLGTGIYLLEIGSGNVIIYSQRIIVMS